MIPTSWTNSKKSSVASSLRSVTLSTDDALPLHSDTTKKGWYTLLDNITAFVPFKKLVDGPTFQSVITGLRAKVDADVLASQVTAIQKKQYELQISWLERGDVPNIEVSAISRGLIQPEPGEVYFLLMSGQMVRLLR